MSEIQELKWMKFNVRKLEEPEFKIIEAMPDGDALLVIWMKLYLKAGQVNDNGYVYIKEGLIYTEETLAIVFNRPLALIKLALRIFEELKLIAIHEGKGILMTHWESEQNTAKCNEIKEQNRKRVAKYRERKKLENGNVTVTLPSVTVQKDNVTVTGQNKNKNKKENKKQHRQDFEELFKSYPQKIGKEQAFSHFRESVLCEDDLKDIKKALDNYLSLFKKQPYRKFQDAKTWFSSWREWVDYSPNQKEVQTFTCHSCKESFAVSERIIKHIPVIEENEERVQIKHLCLNCAEKINERSA